jgi:predicted alpha/beta hydrolase family esterase
MSAAFPVLTQPGWTNSGPGHWQSLWERAHPEWRRVEQRDWELPERGEWVATLVAALIASPRPAVVIGHSIGVITIAHAAQIAPERIAGAFLVAPADVEAPDVAREVRSFAPIPRERLPFPSVLVASRDDAWCSFARAQELARDWGSELFDAGHADHLHTAAGYGPWPEGLARLQALLDSLTHS